MQSYCTKGRSFGIGTSAGMEKGDRTGLTGAKAVCALPLVLKVTAASDAGPAELRTTAQADGRSDSMICLGFFGFVDFLAAFFGGFFGFNATLNHQSSSLPHPVSAGTAFCALQPFEFFGQRSLMCM